MKETKEPSNVGFKMITRQVDTVTENGVLYVIDPDTGEKRKAGPVNGLVCFEIKN